MSCCPSELLPCFPPKTRRCLTHVPTPLHPAAPDMQEGAIEFHISRTSDACKLAVHMPKYGETLLCIPYRIEEAW